MQARAIGGFIAGAAFMYFADPNRGRRRRAITRDKVVAGVHDVANEFDKAGRDLWNRAHAVPAAARSLLSWREANGSVLVDRVRSTIGRAVSHPHAIKARAAGNGCIVLEGPVLEAELDYLLESVRAVPGVHEVASRLAIYRDARGVSSLQGGIPRRRLPELAQQNWTPSLRVGFGLLAGASLYAATRNGGLLGWMGAAAGAGLLVRTIANRPLEQVFGVDGRAGAVHCDKTVHIDAPVEDVYAYWSNFENLPKFMTHLKEVRDLGNGRSHWVAEGPAGISIPWDAEVTRQTPNQLLAWRSVPRSLIHTTGTVRFDKESDHRTRVSIRMSYSPPAGVLGHATAWLFGADPKSEIDDDMVRLKSLLETGKTRAHGARVTREQVSHTTG